MTLFVNGKVFTGTGEDDFVSAFGVDAGRVTRVGDDLHPDAGEQVVDLQCRTVLPGLLDTHSHPAMMSTIARAVSLLPPKVTSVEAVVRALAAHPDLGAGPDTWIEGFGFDEAGYPEGRKPTRQDLDRVSSTQPIFAYRCDLHSAVVNSRALELAGITRDTPDPEAGVIGRDADGEPDGRLIELPAMLLALNARPRRSAADHAAAVASLREHFLSRGIVAVDDLLATYVPDPLATFRAAADLGLDVRFGLYLGWAALKDLPEVPELTDDERTGPVRVKGVKVFMDGAYSDRTAWTEDPYPHSCSHGLRSSSDEDLLAAVEWARRNRVQVAVHAMGDRAINRALDLLADADPWLEDIPSVRIDHATLFSPQMIERVRTARMRFAVISHTVFLFAEWANYANNLSPAQFDIAYPIRSFYEQLPATSLSSDNPATAWDDADNPFLSIRAAVERRAHEGSDMGQAQRVTVPQAVLLYTGRARQVSANDGLGVIAPGAQASFVVLDRDLFTVPVTELDQVRVQQTWLAGKPAWPSFAELTGRQ